MAKLTQKGIFYTLEALDWRGHVELPSADLQWLSAQLYNKLAAKEAEICDACNKAAPIVLETPLGNICAECLEDYNDHVDQIRDALSSAEEGTPSGAVAGFVGGKLRA